MASTERCSFKVGSAFLLSLVAISATGCSGLSRSKLDKTALPLVTIEDAPKWEKAVSAADRERIKGVAAAWIEALNEASKGGYKQALGAEGKLLDPAAALPSPAPSPGNYKCRLIQLGGTGRNHRPFVTSKPAFCYVGADDEGQLWLDKQTGVQQKSGTIFPDENPRRMIFVGQRKAPAGRSKATGGDATLMSTAGLFERIGPMRFRLTVPRPIGRYKLEVLELSPAHVQNDD